MSNISPVDQRKRTLMGLGTLLIGAGIGGPMAYTAFQVAVGNAIKLGPKVGEGDAEKNWIVVGSLADFPEGTPAQSNISVDTIDGWVKSSSQEALWVVRTGDRALTFTATCPHLGCKVNWVAEQNQYFCPCHNSFFEKEGARVSGPTARGLDALENRITGGKIEVVFRRYKGLLGKKIEFI
jgi:menaquinol-cytochrome c reductase iron-sulfur subunit